MNYLAHCLLAPPSPEGLIGCLAPDFSRPHDFSPVHPVLRAAMEEHFAIDAFTDAHPLFLQSRARFRPAFRHYAGALTDIVYDHFLAVNWTEHHPQASLPAFAAHVYTQLDARLELCPAALQDALPRMREQNWLASYETVDGIRQTFARISRRLKSNPDFGPAIGILEEHHAELNREFRTFFAVLNEHLRARRTPLRHCTRAAQVPINE